MLFLIKSLYWIMKCIKGRSRRFWRKSKNIWFASKLAFPHLILTKVRYSSNRAFRMSVPLTFVLNILEAGIVISFLSPLSPDLSLPSPDLKISIGYKIYLTRLLVSLFPSFYNLKVMHMWVNPFCNFILNAGWIVVEIFFMVVRKAKLDV